MKTSLSLDWVVDWMAQEWTGGEMDVVGSPWSARATWRERKREACGVSRAHRREMYWEGTGESLQTEVWVDSGRARLWCKDREGEALIESWEEARDSISSSRASLLVW